MREVDIVLVMDQNYLIPTSVTIWSAILNKKESSHYCFHIICNKFTPDIKYKLRAFESESVKVELIECKTYGFDKLHNPSKSSYCVASPTALLKFKIADLLPTKEKALYIDGDVIIRSDLSKLFETNLSYYFAGVVPDTGSLYSNNPIVKKYKKYFNSGLMLLNLQKLRECQASQTLFELKKNSSNESLMDQNVFNEFFNGRVKLLDVSYNVLYVNLVRSRDKFTIEQFNKKFKTKHQALESISQTAKIVHYSSKDKPWKYSNVPLSDEWLDYYYKYCSHFGYNSSVVKTELSLNCRNDSKYLPAQRRDITVSLTTFPDRINIVHLPITDILNQTIKVKQVVLYLSLNQFPKGKEGLPEALLNLESKGLLIKFVEDDLRAHKKYFYAFRDYSNDLIITIDDDLRFDPFLIERLLLAHYMHPRAIIASRVHLMTGNVKEEKVNPYSEWRKEFNGWINIPSHQLFATHGAGTLFPPHCLNLERLCNAEEIKKLSLAADDIWLKVNEVLSNVQIVLAYPHKKLELIEGSQEQALWKSNVTQNENDRQLDNVLIKYNKISSNCTVVGRIFQSSPYPNEEIKSQKGQAKAIELFDSRNDYKDLYLQQKDRNQRLKNSVSYRIGRIITYIPRRIIALLK